MAFDPQYTLLPTQAAIIAMLTAQTTDPAGIIKGAVIHEGQITDGERVPTDTNGDIRPYVNVVWGNQGAAAGRYAGIAGAAQDLQSWVFGVELYAKSYDELVQFVARVRFLLVGFEPYGAGEITVTRSGQIENPADVKQNHARTGVGLICEAMVGTRTPVL